MRDLASVVTIDKVWPLEGKDRVVGASFVENGYEVMVGKDTQPGMLVAFIQEGAILPVKEQWEFLRKRCFKESVNGFVIKPQKFGCIKSWGLAVPLTDLGLPEKVVSKLKAGEDITDLLEIRKYEPEEDASPKQQSKTPKWVKFLMKYPVTRWIGQAWLTANRSRAATGGFPTMVISKSDETTIQNFKRALEQFKESEVYITAKIEGQSFTALIDWNGKKLGKFYVCSRNNAYKNPNDTVFWKVAKKLDIESKLRKYYEKTGKLIVLQGEQVGPGIQENIYDLPDNDWVVYTMKDQITGKQLPYEEMKQVATDLGLKLVPLVCTGKLGDIMPDVDTAVTFAEKVFWGLNDNKEPYTINGNVDTVQGKLWKNYFQHEGVVVRSMDYDKDKNIGVSFKVKNLAYAEFGLGKIHAACVEYKNA